MGTLSTLSIGGIILCTIAVAEYIHLQIKNPHKIK